MNRNDVAAIALRVFSLWLGCRGMEGALTTLGMISYNTDAPPPAYLLFLVPAVVLGLAVVVWIWANPLARLLLPKRVGDEPAGSWSRDDAALVAFAAVGVYFIGGAVASIGYWALFMHKSSVLDPGIFQPTPSMIASMARACIQLVVGFLLVFGGRGLLRLFRLARPMDGDR